MPALTAIALTTLAIVAQDATPLRAAPSASAANHAQLWQGELLEVYPVLESYEATRELARRHGDHANELEDAIAELDAIGAGAPAWKPALERLIAIVKEHVALEEQELFPRAQQALGDEAARQLERAFLRAKEMAARAFG